MVKIELFYNSNTDNETPKLANELKDKFGNKVEIVKIDTSEEQIPESYGIINPPTAVINEKQKIKIEGHDSLSEIVSKAIF
jgi:thiol-disulfide isomerase/thioredoxin